MLLLAGALGDLVTLVAVSATTLLLLRALGHAGNLLILPWTGALAAAWWCLSATVLLVVRRGTPGMLVAGFGFTRPVRGWRVAPVLLVALLLAATLGLTAAVGLPTALLRMAGGSSLAVVEPE